MIDDGPEQREWLAAESLERGGEARWAADAVRLRFARAKLHHRGTPAPDEPVRCDIDVQITVPGRGTFDWGAICSHPRSFPLTFGPFWQAGGLFARQRGWVLEVSELARDGSAAVVRAARVDAPPAVEILGDVERLSGDARRFLTWFGALVPLPPLVDEPGRKPVPDGAVPIDDFSIIVEPHSTGRITLTLHRHPAGFFVHAGGGCECWMERWHGPYAERPDGLFMVP